MIVGEKIKLNRKRLQLSQEELAEKVKTSRQTISSWENDKTYPDLQTLIMLSELFAVTVESLIKEDVDMMKTVLNEENREAKIIRNKDREILNRLVAVRLILAFTGSLMLYPVYKYYPGLWVLLPVLSLIGALIVTIPIQIYRKKYNLKEYKEIVAFFDQKYDY